MIRDNITKIQSVIKIALNSRTQPKITGDKVKLIAVSKTYPANVVNEALVAGLTVFGENKVQEAQMKKPLVAGGVWHLIGHLQTNKVKKAVDLFEFIYSVDSVSLLLAIDKEAAKKNKVQNILLQVNIAQEESKFGLAEQQLEEIIQKIDELSNVCLRGLMVIAPETTDRESVRPIFKKGYEKYCYLAEANVKNAHIDTLSMGMSGDFDVAIEEGANNVRLGSLLFGKRNYSMS